MTLIIPMGRPGSLKKGLGFLLLIGAVSKTHSMPFPRLHMPTSPLYCFHDWCPPPGFGFHTNRRHIDPWHPTKMVQKHCDFEPKSQRIISLVFNGASCFLVWKVCEWKLQARTLFSPPSLLPWIYKYTRNLAEPSCSPDAQKTSQRPWTHISSGPQPLPHACLEMRSKWHAGWRCILPRPNSQSLLLNQSPESYNGSWFKTTLHPEPREPSSAEP